MYSRTDREVVVCLWAVALSMFAQALLGSYQLCYTWHVN